MPHSAALKGWVMRRLIASLVAASGLIVATGSVHAARWATYHINYLYLTPYKVSTTQQIDQFTNASPGTKYLVISFHAMNRDDVQQEVSYSDMKLAVGGRVIDEDFSDPPQPLDGQVLDVGGKLDGGVTFVVASNAHAAQVRWSPDNMMSDAKWPTYSWNVTF